MISRNVEPSLVSEICENVKQLGYSPSARVRIYGEDFEVLSDPYPEAGGIAVRAIAKKDSRICVLQLPATLLQGMKGRTRFVAA